MHTLDIEIVPGKQAPKYPDAIELACTKVVITEQGTKSGLPIVDFVLKGPGGGEFVLVLTGRLLNMVSAAVRGVNKRNHGVEEP